MQNQSDTFYSELNNRFCRNLAKFVTINSGYLYQIWIIVDFHLLPIKTTNNKNCNKYIYIWEKLRVFSYYIIILIVFIVVISGNKHYLLHQQRKWYI
jgi:hypothetical protein